MRVRIGRCRRSAPQAVWGHGASADTFGRQVTALALHLSDGGQLRLQCERGWASVATRNGRALLKQVGNCTPDTSEIGVGECTSGCPKMRLKGLERVHCLKGPIVTRARTPRLYSIVIRSS